MIYLDNTDKRYDILSKIVSTIERMIAVNSSLGDFKKIKYLQGFIFNENIRYIKR